MVKTKKEKTLYEMSRSENASKLRDSLFRLFVNRYRYQVRAPFCHFPNYSQQIFFFKIESWHGRNTRVLLKTTLFVIH